MSFEFLGIDHIQLAAPEGCEAEARLFFANMLGWAELDKPESLKKRGGVWFECGKNQVHIGVQKDFTPATKAHPAFRVVNIGALRARLLSNQVMVIEDDARNEEGAERFYVADPFGNRLEFIQWSTD
ncbi:MAG: Glyoxalase/bleomycin resistance protein/dioxygenase [Paenibacillus sp.]|nr:Glyoxalase/bleomycin resistance protein/dioxygenase [Paenibacillus sp.]